jgi:hypothetical protein
MPIRAVNSGPDGTDIPKVVIAKLDETGSVINPPTEEQIGEVQETPTQYTLLRRLKDLLTGIILATGNAIIGKVKVVDDLGNVIGSLGNALDVHVTDVHDITLNRYFVQYMATTSSLDGVVNAQDKTIDIQASDYANFPVGSWIQIKDGNKEETNFCQVTIAGGSPTLTLDRPLDNSYANGSIVTLVQTNLATAVGSLGSPISFKLLPPSDETWHIKRFLLASINTTLESSFEKFLSLDALTNGVILRHHSNGNTRIISHWKKDADFIEDMYDFYPVDKPPTGKFGTQGRFTLSKSESYSRLRGANGDFLEILIQNDLTVNSNRLEDWQIKAQGHLEG